MTAGITDYPAFVGAIILFLLIPGPGNLALVMSTAKGGLRGGLAATLGLILGDQVLMWLAVAGVAAALQAHPALFSSVRWAGAAYLAWLGLRLLFARQGTAPVIEIRPRHYLRQAWTITVLNPKAIVFYMAFFPLFIDPAGHPGLPTFALMAATVAALSVIYCVTAVLLAHTLAERLRANPLISRLLEKLAGAVLVGFGIRLLGEH